MEPLGHLHTHTYKGGLKILYDDIITTIDEFLTKRIQALQH